MAATSFATALAFTLQSEGGWSDDPRDPGGATMEGITLATYRLHFPNASKTDLRDITDEEVGDIYRNGYWNAVKGDELPAGVDLSVFDFGVNAGPGRSIRLLQRSVGTAVDGILGPASLMAIQAQAIDRLISVLAAEQLAFYQGLDGWETFGNGWARRTAQREQAARQLAGIVTT